MVSKTLCASRTLLSTALSSAIAAAIAATSGVAVAQEGLDLEEIVITGSRIRMTGMDTPTPVTALESSELNVMAPGNMIESLSQLPQFLNNATSQTSSNYAGSGGSSNLNLRGIGSQRTLVLLDGRRVTPSSRTNTVDINLFPDAMIKRVETVTGGASAAYGTDAVAGVVNFILDTNFTGFAVSGQAGTTSRSDADNWEGSISFGTDLGERTHLLFSAGGYQIDGIDAYENRDWYQGWGTVTNPNWQAAVNRGECSIGVLCAAGPQLIRAPHVVSTKYTAGGLTVSPVAALNNLEFLSDGTVRPFRFSSLGTQTGTFSQSIDRAYGGGTGDGNPHGDRGGEGGLQSALDRENAFLYIDHDLTDNLNVYGQVVYGSNETNSPATQTVHIDIYRPVIFQDNAFLPEGLRQTMIDNNVQSFGLSSMRTPADLAQSRLLYGNEMLSYTFGFKSEIQSGIFEGFSFDGYAQRGETDVRIRMQDYSRADRIYIAMDAVQAPNGTIQCRAALLNPNQYGDCVPLNLLGAGRASQEAIDYALGRNDGTNVKVQAADLQQDIVDLSMSGEVFEGWGAGPISTAFGVAYREDSIVQRIRDYTNPTLDPNVAGIPRNDPALGIQGIPNYFAGAVSGVQFAGASNFAGTIRVREAFNEWLVPLVSDLPLVQQLNANVAARWADYSGSGEVWSWKYGLDWSVVDDLRMRGTVSRDVRAGSLAERFDTQLNGSSAVDPLRGSTTGSFSQVQGGNPNIAPEKALTWTTGFVYQPSFVEGLSLSIDYYSINTKGLIRDIGAANIVSACANGDVAQCANVERGPDDGLGYGVGPITRVYNAYQNVGEARVAGADLEISYRTDVDWFGGGESVIVRGFYSYLQENWYDTDSNPLTDTRVEQAGDISLAMPRSKLTLNASYNRGPLTLFVQERIIGEGNHTNRMNGRDVTEGVQINDNTVKAAYYTDMTGTWTLDQADGAELEFFMNVTNLFDRDPPIRGTFGDFFGSIQHVDLLHDSLGRRYTAGARYRF